MDWKSFEGLLEARIDAAFRLRPDYARYGRVSDGLGLEPLPRERSPTLRGWFWTIDQKRWDMEASFTHKAFDAARQGAFDALVPPEQDFGWLIFDDARMLLRIRLRLPGESSD